MRENPRLEDYLRQISPSEIKSLPCPVWIFHAKDDDNVPVGDSEDFASKHAGKVTLKTVDTGGHGGAYEQGLPQAVAFLASTLKARP
jgi:fermentation-respiration switch protein FrsA (DUF1100 family)